MTHVDRSYASAFRLFEEIVGFPLPSRECSLADIHVFMDGLIKRESGAATIGMRLSAIGSWCRDHNQMSITMHPEIRARMAGLNSTYKRKQKSAISNQLLSEITKTCSGSLIDIRDVAILQLGQSAGLRRSELVALDYGDVVFRGPRMTVYIRDREEFVVVGAIASLQAWLTASGITEGPLFRSVSRHSSVSCYNQQRKRLTDNMVPYIVKKHARRFGLDPKLYSGHSLRAGMVTQATSDGVGYQDTRIRSRHASLSALENCVRL